MTKACSPGLSSSTDRVVLGRIGTPHGLDGSVLVHPETDHPGRFAPGSVVDAAGVSLSIASSRPTERGYLVRFEGVTDRTTAEALRGSELTIEESERRLLDVNEFWPDHLVGLEARDTDGRVVGVVAAVVEGVTQYRLSITTDAGLREVPFVQALVPQVDVAAGYLVIETVDGLI